jgi:hypothetical protein
MGISLVLARTWRVVAAALFAVVAALAAPAQAGGFRCPESGGPQWREVDTEHFAVFTDLSSGKAQDLAGQCTPALAIQRTAVDVLPERLSKRTRATCAERLERLTSSCGAGGSATPPAPGTGEGP